MAAQKYIENVYYHELSRALRGFGYTIINAARGDFELAEVSAELRERFSKRHRQIDEQTEEFLAAHPELQGANVQAIREHLAHKARDRKVRGISETQLRNYWSEQLTEAERATLRIRDERQNVESQGRTAAEAVSWAEEHLFERRSVVQEHELWRNALTSARGAAVSVAELKSETQSRPYLRAERDKVSRRDVLAREWAIVLRLVQEAKGRIILSGDTRQHGPAEASDALRAIERYSGLRAAELNEIRRQYPARAANSTQLELVLKYRQAVEAASTGELVSSLRGLEKMGAVVECGLSDQRERPADAYLGIAARGESAIVVSQTRAEAREINEAVRA